MIEIVLRIASLCLLLASAETLNGIFRAVLLVPSLGKKRALILSAVIGLILAFFSCYFMVPGIGLDTTESLVVLGVILSIFMAGFDVIIARVVMKLSWGRVMRDFNPKNGNYLSAALIVLATFPLLVISVQGIN